MEITDETVRAGLAEFDQSLVDYRADPAVVRRVSQYIQEWPINSGRMLARSARYYPVFEAQLAAAGMPLALKHLSIVESGLRPWATSWVGAGGLWQLMPGTARELGLSVDEELDERLDPALGCAAGLEYLRRQYARYGNWASALAAYNCGPGNVNRAVRRTGSKNYWRYRRRLPRETRNYLPSFIAASYVMAYHHRHGLPASPMELDLQLTETLVVHRRLSFHRIARVTQLRPARIAELNPQYLRGYLPGRPGGHLLTLPARTLPALRDYLSRHPAEHPEEDADLPWASPLLRDSDTDPDRHYDHFVTAPQAGDSTIRQVAERHGVPLDRMLVWSNRGELDSLATDDRLSFYAVRDYLPYDRTRRPAPDPLPRIPGATTARPGHPGLTRRSKLPPPPGTFSLAPAAPPPRPRSFLGRLLPRGKN